MDWKKLIFEDKPFDGMFVLDVHGHIGADARMQLSGNSAADLVHTNRRVGVDAVVVSSIPGLASDWKWGNNEVAEACAQFPGEILGYAVPNPFYEDCDLSPFFSCDMGFRGIKIHGNMQAEIPENDPRYDHAYELADKLGLPVLFHAWMPYEVERAADVAGRYPNLKVILGHSGMTALAQAADACRKHENIWCDTAISCSCDASIEILVDQVGEDRVVFGSDLGFFDSVHTLGKLALSRLSDTQKEKILGLTAKELFGL